MDVEKKDNTQAQKPADKDQHQQQKGKDNKKKKVAEEEMSEEDIQKKEELELMVTRIQDPEEGVQRLALETLKTEIKSATASMTAVPKPLKFLRVHYDHLKTVFENFPEGENKKSLADVISILAMTMAAEGTRESLHYKLKGNSSDIGSWAASVCVNATPQQTRQSYAYPVKV